MAVATNRVQVLMVCNEDDPEHTAWAIPTLRIVWYVGARGPHIAFRWLPMENTRLPSR